MTAQPQPYRNVGGRPPGVNRRRKDLIDGYIETLGGRSSVTPLQMVDIERAVALTLLAQETRAKALRGETVKIADLTRLEGAADRAVRRLGIKPGSTAKRVVPLRDRLRGAAR
jgi:hypothetical protein